MEAILTEAYRRIGTAVTFKCLPPKRDLIWANNFTIDASAIRSKEALQDYPNLVEVQVPLFQYRLCAFTADPDITIHTWKDLRGYRVGAALGGIVTETLLKRY